MIKCPQPQAHPDRCGCRPVEPDAFEIARHSKRLVEQQRERIAALEAECDRLRVSLKDADAGMMLFLEQRDALGAELQALKAQQAEQKPACEVSAEIYLPDGTSDFITRRLPIGTKLYVAPPAAQDVSGLVEALEWCENWFSKHCPTSKVDGFFPIVHPMLTSIRNALAAHRQAQQQGAGHPTYKTKPGDSVMGIALRQLKDESRWVEIRDLNAQAFPDIGPHDYYPVGTLLKLPAA